MLLAQETKYVLSSAKHDLSLGVSGRWRSAEPRSHVHVITDSLALANTVLFVLFLARL